ncbi:energy-coupling factor transport system ATP-binding protein [Paenibacillus sp. DS2015]|uniref:ATP-binding cassette domain-containing protein n=1 Tax=Paenibacillus sp. DS2015 TaxID=3373917 RepID=UPI003D25D0D5
MEQHCLVELVQVTVTPTEWVERLEALPILKEVSIRIDRGQFITLVGRNGSGKSTLAKVVAGFRTAGVTGSMILRAESAAGVHRIPIVMQQPEAAMVGATPWEDVVLMLEQNEMEWSQIIPCAEQALHQVGMGERMHQPIETLSGGQKQLVAIAGCLAAHSPLLVLDEVTAMLDPEAAMLVLERVRALHKSGVTVIWITQKLEELRPGDRIVAMNDGKIAYDGLPEGWFSRSINGHTESVCEQLGFEAPYAARVAWELELLGVRLQPFPFTADMLAEAVSSDER